MIDLPDTPAVRDAAQRDGVADLDVESLCVAALFHDSGTTETYNGPARFEVEGADAAAAFLQSRGWSSAMVDPIWEAIAAVEARHPRAGLEEILQTLVIQQALNQPQKAVPPSWVADLVREHGNRTQLDRETL
jgi:hypothetical protein